MTKKDFGQCECCGKPATGTISLAVGANNKPNMTDRFYIPNEHVREAVASKTAPDVLREVPFCSVCMKTVENNLRATILYLKAEAGKLSIS